MRNREHKQPCTFNFRLARDSAGIRTGIVRSKRTLTVHSRGLGRFDPCEANFLSRGGLHLRRSLFNKICDSSRLRYIDSVAALDLNDRSTGALGHSTLGVRWNHLVLGGDQVPARLGPPRWFADRAANGTHAPRNLGVSHKRGFFWVHVGCERGWKLRLVEEQKAVLRRQYRRYGRGSRGGLNKPCHPPTPVSYVGSHCDAG